MAQDTQNQKDTTQEYPEEGQKGGQSSRDDQVKDNTTDMKEFDTEESALE